MQLRSFTRAATRRRQSYLVSPKLGAPARSGGVRASGSIGGSTVGGGAVLDTSAGATGVRSAFSSSSSGPSPSARHHPSHRDRSLSDSSECHTTPGRATATATAAAAAAGAGGGGDALGPDGQFFLSSSLQLMEDVSRRRAEINQVLPILRMLLDAKRGALGSRDQDSLARLQEWVRNQEEERSRMQRFKDSVVSGWLKKLDSHKITQRKRWVVIDGSNLMYYEDRAVRGIEVTCHCTGLSCPP